MKVLKIINILCYFSLFTIPMIILMFMISWFTPVKVVCIVSLFIIIIFQILNYKKTKIKFIGIRILTTIIITLICVFISKFAYGKIKTIQGNEILKNIQRIESENIILTQNDLQNTKLEFVKDKFMILKNSTECKIYYLDGKVEETYILSPGRVIVINNEKFYLRNSKLNTYIIF